MGKCEGVNCILPGLNFIVESNCCITISSQLDAVMVCIQVYEFKFGLLLIGFYGVGKGMASSFYQREDLYELLTSPQPHITVNTKQPVTTLDHVMYPYFLKCISSTITFDHSSPFASHFQCIGEKMASYKTRHVNSNYQMSLPVQG